MIATPTSTPNRVLRLAAFETLAEGLDHAAAGDTGINFFSGRGVLDCALSYRELRERAVDLALRLAAQKIERHARVAIVAETGPDFPIFFYACQYAGLIPVPLPLNVNLGTHAAYVERLGVMLRSAGAAAACAPQAWLPFVKEAAQNLDIGPVGAPEEFYGLAAKDGALRPLAADEPCYIQYSSGSTALPKGVLATQRSVTSNARGISEFGLRLQPGDRAASWLPLYHDMGLVGFCITPMLSQISVDYLATASFVRRPLTWLAMMSQQRSTVAFSPTAGYDVCVRAAAHRNTDGIDLSPWRIAGIGGEMIRRPVLKAFAETFAAAGFDRRAFLPSYGLAEATLAVAFSDLSRGADFVAPQFPVDVDVATGALPARNDHNGHATRRSFAICGRVLPGHELEIRDPGGRPCAAGEIGRIFIRGPSIMAGYFDNAEATAGVLSPDGWLDTGDLGFLRAGELVITGRGKDLIIHNGRNIWPEDIEWSVERKVGSRPGSVAAFTTVGSDGGENLTVLVEARLNGEGDLDAFEKDVRAAVYQASGLDGDIVLVPPRSLVFTSSGKLSRAGSRRKFECGEMARLGPADLAARPLTAAQRLSA